MNKTSFLIAGAAWVLSACSPPPAADEPVRAVKVMTVAPASTASSDEYAGEVRAQLESRLGFRVGGKIIRRQAELGQRVKAGQLLAQLDPQDYKLAADAARAQLAAAATNRDLAAADFKRFKALKDQNFISGAELERRETALKAAQAQFEQARSQLAVQGNQASYAALLADVSGVVTAVDAEPGQVVAAGAPVLRIAADGVRDGVFSVPEDKLAAIRVGAPVKIRLWAQNTELPGRVREVAASSDPVTRTYPVKVSIDATEPPALGSTVYLTPLLAESAAPTVIKLPTTALFQTGNATAVWLLDAASMTVKAQRIEVAAVDGNEVIVAAGLQPGMRVVSAGAHVLSAGQKVSIYQSNMPVAHTGRAQAAPDLIAKPGVVGSAASSASTAK